MINELKEFTEELVKSLVTEPDLVKVQDFLDEEENPIIEIMVSEVDMGKIIGKGGKMLKDIGTLARKDIVKLLGTKIYLELWVKVEKNWRDTPRDLSRFGYKEEDY